MVKVNFLDIFAQGLRVKPETAAEDYRTKKEGILMCEICHQYICPNSCPNAEEGAVGVCAYCEDIVYEGQHRIREVGGRLFHAECLEELSVAELLAQFEIEVSEEL